ncbi:MAG TPA: 7-cyano-7-deazaguanine synthase [Phycisphaerae bacterium]|nr:7-cyano-7-deazaguanine synthase [Phycisphaerae bacterium]HNU46549.1 7-cyano-7-deazaguanine synthase [Phycisphaerae bacterium]
MANVVALSGGGIRAAVAAAQQQREHLVILAHVDYGQVSAAAERRALHSLVERFSLGKLVVLQFPYLQQLRQLPGLSLSAGNPPAPASGEPAGRPGGRLEPLPPGSVRGLLPTLLAIGVQVAQQVAAGTITIGLTDTSPGPLSPPEAAPGQMREFVHAYNAMLETALPSRSLVRVEAPLIDLSFPEVIRLGQRYRVPFEWTYSCAGKGPQPCGACEGCQARARAFVAVGEVDPALAAPPPARV